MKLHGVSSLHPYGSVSLAFSGRNGHFITHHRQGHRFLGPQNELLVFSPNWQIYNGNSLPFCEKALIFKLRTYIAAHRHVCFLAFQKRPLGVIMAASSAQIGSQITPDRFQMLQRWLPIALDTLIWRFHGSQNVTYAIILRSSNIPSHRFWEKTLSI